MIYLKLFYTFFKIGLFTIGGGYAMIPLISDEVIGNGWITEDMLVDFIAISESTPGPFAINIATFVGTQAARLFGGVGFLGAICATVGVVLPSLIIIFLIAAVFTKVTKNKIVRDIFSGLRPAVVGLIAYAFVSIALATLFSEVTFSDMKSFLNIDFIGLGIFAIVFGLSLIKKPKLHPIALIAISALLGMLGYGFL